MAAALTLEQQDRRIRRDWSFRTTLLGNGMARWEGRLQPFSQPYEVSILYVTHLLREGYELLHCWFPEVRVLHPRVTRREAISTIDSRLSFSLAA